MGKNFIKLAWKISKSKRVRRVSQGWADYEGFIWTQLTQQKPVLPPLPAPLVRGAISKWAKKAYFGPEIEVFQL